MGLDSLNKVKAVVLTSCALLAFAGNSILCRLALKEDAIDATSFTAIRLLSGAAVLSIILLLSPSRTQQSYGSWKSGLMLFTYATAFSFAYMSLDTGIGALILFGSVQITMIGSGLLIGNILKTSEWLGIACALAGFIYLLLPGATAPPIKGVVLMVLAGIAWSTYTLAGKHSKQPLQDTCFNFLRCLPFAALLIIVKNTDYNINLSGTLLAITSGGITSGLGYAIWYSALKSLKSVQAAVLQLLVPVIAATGGIMITDETLSFQFLIASFLILGGTLITFKTPRAT